MIDHNSERKLRQLFEYACADVTKHGECRTMRQRQCLGIEDAAQGIADECGEAQDETGARF